MGAEKKRITLRDVAKRAGVHYSTVSLALRNRGALPEDTRERVRRAAAELGYRPDPLLASLASYRRARPAAGYRATLAWVTNFPARDAWREEEIYAEYFAGARERAQALGFRLQEFWRREPALTPARASQILTARGIEGLVIAPQPTPAETLELEWERFSAVTIGYSLARPALHMVCPNQYRCMKLAMENLAARGYRRIGLVMLRASDERVDHNWLAGFLVAQQALAARDRIAPLLPDRWDAREFAAWLERTRPDAVVSKCAQVPGALRELGHAVPRDLGLAMLTRAKPGRNLAGVNEAPEEVGAAAIDFLAGMLHRNERGMPAQPRRLLIEGRWIEGATVR
jgi:DNA-binding LacI/PurR family transcriptional regulator